MTSPATRRAAHRLSPIAAKTVDVITAEPDMLRRHIHATIAAAGEARAALEAYDRGELGGPEGPKLADRLRDILAICEAAEQYRDVIRQPVPAGVDGTHIGTRGGA